MLFRSVDVCQRRSALKVTAHNTYAVQSNCALPSSRANDEPARTYGMIFLASIQASRAASGYATAERNGAAASYSRGIPARKTAPSTGGLQAVFGPFINLADTYAIIISDNEGQVEEEDRLLYSTLKPNCSPTQQSSARPRSSWKKPKEDRIPAKGKRDLGFRKHWSSMRYNNEIGRAHV